MSKMAEKLEFLRMKKELEIETSKQKAEIWKNARVEASTKIAQEKDAIIRKRSDHIHMNSLEKINLSKAPKFDKREWHHNFDSNNAKANAFLESLGLNPNMDTAESLKNLKAGSDPNILDKTNGDKEVN